MKKKQFQLLLISGMLLFIVSCQKGIDKPIALSEESTSANNSNAQKGKKKVFVSNVDELYAAVNDPVNSGSEIALAAGTYVLNADYPNGGRLELQTDMTLKGQPGQIDAVLIDQSSLPSTSLVLAVGGRTGGIRMGKGTNSLEWLSLKGANVSANPFSVINTDLLSIETYVNISHVKVDVNGCVIGINLRNRLAEHSGRKIYATLEDNEVFGAVNFNGLGVAAQIANGASQSLIKVTMRKNYIHGNRIGLLTFCSAQNATVINSRIEITSYADRIEGNGCGIDFTSAVNQTTTTVANNNTAILKMYGSSISYNNPAGAPQLAPVNGAFPGAMTLTAGYNSVNNIGGFDRASNNTMLVECTGCTISNNGSTDIYAYAAWCLPACVLAGSNNLAELYLHGVSANTIIESAASVPAEAAGTNVLNIFR
jgi:hypothetical protein